MSDREASDVGPSARWLLVSIVVAIFLAIGAIGFLYQPQPPGFDLLQRRSTLQRQVGCERAMRNRHV